MSTDELTCRIVLSTAAEPGDAKLGQALARFGIEAVIDQLDRGSGSAIGLGSISARWDSQTLRAAADSELRRADALGVQFIAPGDPGWPTQLDDLGVRAPVLLRVMGTAHLRTAAARSVALVGSRAATRYGETTADELASALAGLGWCVISGGAFGIDAAAHAGAMAAGGLSIAVSAAGADRPSPTANTSLFARLYDYGAVVSEVPLGASASSARFLVRNRVIAALSRCVVVVEAALRSGARSTAREAFELGRVVAAVPGPVSSSMSAGCHELIRDQSAVLVRDAAQVVELLVPGSPSGTSDAGQRSHHHQLVLDVLSPVVPRSAQSLGRDTGMGVGMAVSTLLSLEQEGLVHREPDGWFRL